MHALVRFAHIAGGNTFTTAELYPRVLAALGCPAERYTLASLRYDLAKLRAKGLVAKRAAACPTVWARSELPRWPCSPLPRFRDRVPAG